MTACSSDGRFWRGHLPQLGHGIQALEAGSQLFHADPHARDPELHRDGDADQDRAQDGERDHGVREQIQAEGDNLGRAELGVEGVLEQCRHTVADGSDPIHAPGMDEG